MAQAHAEYTGLLSDKVAVKVMDTIKEKIVDLKIGG
jgi:hypothetical protein